MRNLAVVIGTILTLAVIGEAAQCAVPDSDVGQLEEVIVTAQKRSENLQSVPMSISALQGDQLAADGIHDGEDLVGRVAGLSAGTAGPGRQDIALRGISTTAGAPTVGIYLDEVPLLQTGAHGVRSAIDPGYFDLARIEVLRGPQGTLYGESSIGGTIRYLTNAPDPTRTEATFAGETRATDHGAGSYNTDVMLNLPLVQDRLAIRAVGSFESNGGFINDLVGNFRDADRQPIGPYSTVHNVNSEQRAFARVQLRFSPTDSLVITPAFMAQSLHEASMSAFDIPGGDLTHRAPLYTPEPYSDSFTLPSLTIAATGHNWEFVSSTAYLRRTSRLTEDQIDSTEDNVIAPLRAAGVAIPAAYSPAQYFQVGEGSQFSQEMRLSSQGEAALAWVLGAFYLHSNLIRHDRYILPGFYQAYGNPPQAQEIFGAPITPDNNFYSGDIDDAETQVSVFGDLTYAFASKWKAAVGARARRYDNSFTRLNTGTTNGGTQFTSGMASESGVDPRILVSYEPREAILTYADVSTGYRPGGANSAVPLSLCGLSEQPPSYKADKVRNYELGAKTRWMDNRVQLNAALFYIDWTGIQQTVLLPICGYGYTANAGRAVSRGVETEYDIKFTERFSVYGQVSLTDATIRESPNPAYVGLPVQNAPRFTAALNAEYRVALPDEVSAYARMGYSYVSTSYPDFSRDDSDRFQRPYALTNLRFGIDKDRWSVALFVENLFNVQADLSFFESNNYPPYYDRMLTNRPRSFGVHVQYKIR